MDFRYIKKEFIDPDFIQEIQSSLKTEVKPYDGNADDLIETGFYSITGADLTGKGFPVNLSNVEGLVEVYKTENNFITQKFYFGNSFGSNYYVRGRSTNALWGNWTKILTDEVINDGVKDFYINSSLGTDSPKNGNSSGAGAFKTISYALSKIKKTNLNRISLNIASGTYNENITISDFNIGEIYLIGESRNNTTVTSISISSCSSVRLNKLTTTNGFDVRATNDCTIVDCGKTVSNGVGLYCLSSKLSVYNAEISNSTGAGIRCDNNSIIYLNQVVGNGNLVGIECRGSVIRKNSTTTITGTTNQLVSEGGQII